MDIFNYLLIIFASFLAVPTIVFVTQISFALAGGTDLVQQYKTKRDKVAIIVPAHNEESIIVSTLSSILPQLNDDDVLLVVADNCTDNTITLARESGAIAIERMDLSQRGKGYALDFGLQFLADNNPPEIVIIIDADCHVSANCIDVLARQAKAEQRPVQALYLMHSQENEGIKQAIAEFAWLVKNYIRPLGLKKLGLHCQLMGTGMAFPWVLLRQADLAHGNMVEDMKLGIDLAVNGFSPAFCPSALVSSEFPVSTAVSDEQRKRWEHGHIATIFTETPRLLKAALKQRKTSLLYMALDLSIPPLSLLGLWLLVMFLVTLFFAFFTASYLPLMFMSSLVGIFSIVIFIAWYRFARQILAFKTLCGVPLYIFRKIPLYFSFLIKRQKDWVKTERR